MNYIITLLLIFFYSTIISCQILTVTINDNYEYEHKPEGFTVLISEILDYKKPLFETVKEREIIFKSNIKIVLNYLDENSISNNEITAETHTLPEGSIAINNMEIKLSTKREFEKLEKFVTDLKDLRIGLIDTFTSLDEAFLKQCLIKLEAKARKKAQPYAIAMERKLGETYELKIINHQVTKRSKKSNNGSTHFAAFKVEYSFNSTKD